ncbi:MAG TPA: hypothetical protein VFP10_01205, partial [Candidatus Eisenbacteria bacterium]|nr:hypothetical protein [Candidatus Eisenbacteria bacterium]
MSSFRSVVAQKGWPAAVILSLCLHAVTLVTLFVLNPLLSQNVEARKPDPITVELVEPAQTSEPQFYSPLPEDRASQKPERADFLSNVNSRAQDRTPGGDASLPRMEGESDMPLVALEPQGGASSPSPQDLGSEAAADRAASSMGGEMARRGAAGQTPRVDAETARRAREKALLLQGPDGSSDFLQPQMSNPGGNAATFGDISLNTTAWDYAPWLERFRRELMAHWFAPGAYYYGVLKEGGFAVIEVEITRSGQMARMDLLEEKEHPSFT